MKILAIDPGYERLGIAIIEKQPKQKEILLYSECFKTSAKLPHPQRLGLIQNKIKEIIEAHSPAVLAIETLFFAKNTKTALMVSEARGAIIASAVTSGLDVAEFMPNAIKVAITSYGKSDKRAMMTMIPRLIEIKKDIKSDDEFDAIAVGLTYFAHHVTF